MTNYTAAAFNYAAILLLETAKNADLDEAGIKNALNLALEYAATGACLTVLSVLEYPPAVEVV